VRVRVRASMAAQGINVLNWRVVRRGARPLKKLVPHLPSSAYPHVDILLCHYTEPADETTDTLQKILDLEYPPSKLHVYICDDGRLKSDFKKVSTPTTCTGHALWSAPCVPSSHSLRAMRGPFSLSSHCGRRRSWPLLTDGACPLGTVVGAMRGPCSLMARALWLLTDGVCVPWGLQVDAGEHTWPTPKLNAGAIAQSGDTREAVGEFMAERITAYDEASFITTRSRPPSPRGPDGHRGALGAAALDQAKLTREVFADPTATKKAVPRTDCALGFLEDRYTVPGLPTVRPHPKTLKP
jgi:cellulose synthase/poly-beta-1,6-N-acetylglucosamine synthase-like glycosyltransferase